MCVDFAPRRTPFADLIRNKGTSVTVAMSASHHFLAFYSRQMRDSCLEYMKLMPDDRHRATVPCCSNARGPTGGTGAAGPLRQDVAKKKTDRNRLHLESSASACNLIARLKCFMITAVAVCASERSDD